MKTEKIISEIKRIAESCNQKSTRDQLKFLSGFIESEETKQIKIIEHAKYEVENMLTILGNERSCNARKWKTLKDVLEGEYL